MGVPLPSAPPRMPRCEVCGVVPDLHTDDHCRLARVTGDMLREGMVPSIRTDAFRFAFEGSLRKFWDPYLRTHNGEYLYVEYPALQDLVENTRDLRATVRKQLSRAPAPAELVSDKGDLPKRLPPLEYTTALTAQLNSILAHVRTAYRIAQRVHENGESFGSALFEEVYTHNNDLMSAYSRGDRSYRPVVLVRHDVTGTRLTGRILARHGYGSRIFYFERPEILADHIWTDERTLHPYVYGSDDTLDVRPVWRVRLDTLFLRGELWQLNT